MFIIYRQGPGLGGSSALGFSQGCSQGVWLAWGLKDQLGKEPYMVIAGFSSSRDCWIENLRSLLAVAWRWPSVFCHTDLSNKEADFVKARGRKSASKMEVIITKRTSPQYCSCVLVRSKLLKERGSHDTRREEGSLGPPEGLPPIVSYRVAAFQAFGLWY